jgi:hypothetical protein
MMLQGGQRALQSDYGVVKQVTREWHVSDPGDPTTVSLLSECKCEAPKLTTATGCLVG